MRFSFMFTLAFDEYVKLTGVRLSLTMVKKSEYRAKCLLTKNVLGAITP